MTTRNELVVLDADDAESLKIAHRLLQNPSWIARASDTLGEYIETGLKSLPVKAQQVIGDAVTKSIQVALNVALKTIDMDAPAAVTKPSRKSNWLHVAAAAASGAAGGAFGLYALPIELPLSTAIMMRSIADIARSEGFDLNNEATRMQCVTVLALGGKGELQLGEDGKPNDQAEIGYFAIRQTMAVAVTDATVYLATGAKDMTATPLLRLASLVAERFGGEVTPKVAAQLIPVIGAVTGAAINTFFTDHFQDMARGHFVVLRLQQKYGENYVKDEYNRLTQLSLSEKTNPADLALPEPTVQGR